MSQTMVGIVLWAHQSDQKAVFWCEDHGELAYWRGPESSLHDGGDLEVGDLVQFDIHEGGNLRHASNPQRLEEKQFFGLVQSLRDGAGSAASGDADRQAAVSASGKIVAFPDLPRREKNVA